MDMTKNLGILMNFDKFLVYVLPAKTHVFFFMLLYSSLMNALVYLNIPIINWESAEKWVLKQTLPSYPQIFSFLAAALLSLPVELAFISFYKLLKL